jgi:parallel beta helix pectate lyase-like protein
MARILLGLGLAAAVAAVAVTVFAGGSQAAPQAVRVVPPQPRPAAVPGPAPLAEAKATIQRTFVSTSGNDANPCTRPDPCRSFPVAIASTTAGGEVIALDSGGYGAFSVDKSITVAGAPGAHVAITAFTGSGITVNVGPDDAVVLRNLYLTGLGASDGILLQGGGRIFVESVVVAGFTVEGLEAQPGAGGAELFIRNSVFRNNGDAGVLINAPLTLEIADSRSERNGWGFFIVQGRGSVSGSIATRNVADGFVFEFGAVVTVTDCVVDANGAGGAEVFDNGTAVAFSGVAISNNGGAGLFVQVGAPGGVRIGGSTVIGNSTGLQQNTGTFESFGDNLVRGNGTNTSGTIPVVAKT